MADDVADYFLNLVRVVASNAKLDFALQYVKGIRQEIECLSHLAQMLPPSYYDIAKLYHPKVKTTTVARHKLTDIFHIQGEQVIVGRIMPSCIITY